MGEDGVICLQNHGVLTDANTVSYVSFAASVLLIDPCVMTRESLHRMLISHSLAVESVGRTPDRITARVVVMHIGAARVDALETEERIAEARERAGGEVGIAIISDVEEPGLAIWAIRRGLRGYLPTSLSAAMVAAAVGIMQAGGIFVPVEAIAAMHSRNVALKSGTDAAGNLSLTERERDVLLALERGDPNKIIAHGLNITESTVKVHVRHIMKKLHATNRTQLAFLSRRMLAADSDTRRVV